MLLDNFLSVLRFSLSKKHVLVDAGARVSFLGHCNLVQRRLPCNCFPGVETPNQGDNGHR